MKVQFILSLWFIQAYGSQNSCCGGILNAEYGELRHSVGPTQQQSCPETCIWTIQTPNHAAMRLKLHHLVSNAPLVVYTAQMLATGNALRLSDADINSSFDLSGGPLIVAVSDSNAQLTLTWKSFPPSDTLSAQSLQPQPLQAIDPEIPPTILFASQDKGLKLISTATSNVTDISSEVSAYGVVYDSDYSDTYWSNFDGVYRTGPDGKEEIISSVDGFVYGIALDKITGNLYLCNHTGDSIAICSRTGSNWTCAEIVTHQVSAPVGIVLHSSKGMMYWTNRLDNIGIMRAGMDGSRVTPIITEGLISPAGLAIDYPAERLYWTDTSTNRIEFSDLNGENRGVVLTLKSDAGPFGISVLGEKLFWSNYRDGSIQQSTKIETEVTKLYEGKSALFHIEAIGGRNAEESSRVINRCKGRCSHMCALAFKSSKCICPEGMFLAADKITCTFR